MIANHIFSFKKEEITNRINRLKKALNKQKNYSNLPECYTEENFRDFLHVLVGGTKEFAIKGVGRIDILTDYFCIELKKAGSAKKALGQLLCYCYAVGGTVIPTLAIIGKMPPKILAICNYYGYLVLQASTNEQWVILNEYEILDYYDGL